MAITCVAQREAAPLINTTQVGIAKLSRKTMQNILGYLSYKETIRSIPLVQRTWHNLTEHLNLSCGSITDEVLPLILSKFKNIASTLNPSAFSLKNLNLRENQITDDALSALSFLPLTELDLGSNSITGEGLSALSKLPLTKLDLSENNIEGADFSYLSDLPLTELDLSENPYITDKDLEFLKNRTLTTLDFAYSSITGTGFASPTPLISLRNLNLHSSKISDDGLKYVSRLSLIKLNLSDNNITDTGLEYLSHLSSLRQLSLGFCKKITDLGLTSLAKMHLTCLNISYTNITDFGIFSLIKMPLEKLCLDDTQITDFGISYLKKMPLLVISSDNCYSNYGFGLKK